MAYFGHAQDAEYIGIYTSAAINVAIVKCDYVFFIEALYNCVGRRPSASDRVVCCHPESGDGALWSSQNWPHS